MKPFLVLNVLVRHEVLAEPLQLIHGAVGAGRPPRGRSRRSCLRTCARRTGNFGASSSPRRRTLPKTSSRRRSDRRRSGGTSGRSFLPCNLIILIRLPGVGRSRGCSQAPSAVRSFRHPWRYLVCLSDGRNDGGSGDVSACALGSPQVGCAVGLIFNHWSQPPSPPIRVSLTPSCRRP